jgi:hypothetical protein
MVPVSMFHGFQLSKIQRIITQLSQRLSLGFVSLLFLYFIIGCHNISETPSDPADRIAPSAEAEISRPTPVPVFEFPPPVDRDRLKAYLTELSIERYTEAQKQAARDYIKSVLSHNHWEIEEHPFPGGINIIARQPNRPNQAGEILVGAHYDTVQGTPGADDNATGIAALLELSQTFQNYQAPQALTLVFFDLEEAGAIGSSAYTNESQNLAQLNGAIILEMLGYTCHTPRCQWIPPELNVQPPSDQGDFLSIIGDQEHAYLLDSFDRQTQNELKLFSLKVPFKGLLSPILLRSDHAPFWLKGVGAVMVSDTAFLRNPNYHRASDTSETIDLDFLTRSTDLVTRVTAELLHTPPHSEQSL